MNGEIDIIGYLAESRIIEAQKNGEFDNLPGAGKPLQLEDSPFVSPELKMAYKVMKNSGFLPEEIENRKEIDRLAQLLENNSSEMETIKATERLKFIFTRMKMGRQRHMALEENDAYLQKIIAVLEKHGRKNNRLSA